MAVFSIISMLMFEDQTIYGFGLGVLLIVGYWAMFKKSGIDPRWAIPPFARDYMLARCADREAEGRVVSVVNFFIAAIDIFLFLDDRFELPEDSVPDTFTLALSAVIIVLFLIKCVYQIRIYNGILQMYRTKGAWMLLWLLLPSAASLIFGFSPKYVPEMKAEEVVDASMATISGKNVQGMKDGLTVNLEERTAKEFFQKKYLLRDIHMYIKPGHMVLLLGGSGAGKTTFLNAVNGYEKAKAKVTLNGGDMYAEYKKMQYEVGFVPQQELMRSKDTVYRTLMDAALLRLPVAIRAKDRKNRVDEVMKIFGLTPVRGNLVEKLSGGQKKRLSIAMEFISNPSLFILDEPDSGLDGVMARELMAQLRMIADQGKIVMVITHTPDRVIDLFDDVIVLAKDTNRTGRLAFYGSIEEARSFFGKEKMEEIVLTINRKEEGGEGRADEFIRKYAEVQHA